jgi:hypothetical protein
MKDILYLKVLEDKLKTIAKLMTHEEYVSAGVHIGILIGVISSQIEKLDKKKEPENE